MKKVVKEGYHFTIKGTINRLLHGEIDNLLNHLLKVLVVDPPNPDQALPIVGKFSIYREIWKAILETLYEKFLPHIKYEFDWTIELTPYSYMLCELTKEDSLEEEFQLLQNQTGWKSEDIEREYEEFANKIGLKKLNLYAYLENHLPESVLPESHVNQLRLLVRLMNFPPFEELAIFQGKYRSFINSQFSTLSRAFPGYDDVRLEGLGMNEPLHYSYFHFNHQAMEELGIEGLISSPFLSGYKTTLNQVKSRVGEVKNDFIDQVISPLSGEKQDVQVPETMLHYRAILEKTELSKRIGFLHYRQFVDHYKHALSDNFYSFFSKINHVDQPKCLILVEGESEEVAIPILGFRKRFILAHHQVQVYNSKSKQKLKEDFFSFKAKYPKRKIVCLLDSDAVRERDDIQRVIENKKHQYRMVFIEKGTFEDLFDLDASLEALNELYPEGEAILKSDIDLDKDFLTNIKRLMFKKKKAEFDKVLFARRVALRLDTDHFPEEINQLFEIVKEFSRKGKWLRISES